MNEMIERRKVVAYLRYLATYVSTGMSSGFHERTGDKYDEDARNLLTSGLMAASMQIEEGVFDRWEPKP